MRWESYHSNPPDRGVEGLNIVLMELGGLVLWTRVRLWDWKSSILGDVGRCKSFDWERFLPWQISRGNHLAPIRITGACSIAKVRRHNSIFQLAHWDTGKVCEAFLQAACSA